MSGGLLLNLDGGELDDEPEELYALADVVHVACGGHAGDAASMARVVASLPEGAVAAPVYASPELGMMHARDMLAELGK